MIPLDRFKNLMGDEAKKLSDEETRIIREAQYNFAEIAFDTWAFKKKIKKAVGRP